MAAFLSDRPGDLHVSASEPVFHVPADSDIIATAGIRTNCQLIFIILFNFSPQVFTISG